jgi:hypothetical protein
MGRACVAYCPPSLLPRVEMRTRCVSGCHRNARYPTGRELQNLAGRRPRPGTDVTHLRPLLARSMPSYVRRTSQASADEAAQCFFLVQRCAGRSRRPGPRAWALPKLSSHEPARSALAYPSRVTISRYMDAFTLRQGTSFRVARSFTAANCESTPRHRLLGPARPWHVVRPGHRRRTWLCEKRSERLPG